jgi:hypothetical protein
LAEADAVAALRDPVAKEGAALADLGAGAHRSGDVATRLGVKVESVAPLRSGLIKKGMIYSPAHGDTAFFTVPLFDDFMRRTIPAWKEKG